MSADPSDTSTPSMTPTGIAIDGSWKTGAFFYGVGDSGGTNPIGHLALRVDREKTSIAGAANTTATMTQSTTRTTATLTATTFRTHTTTTTTTTTYWIFWTTTRTTTASKTSTRSRATAKPSGATRVTWLP